MMGVTQNNNGSIELAGFMARRHVVTAGEATANQAVISLADGLAAINTFVVQILRSNAVATSDAVITASGTNLTVADGSTYNMTTGDVIMILAAGARAE
ncbi:MAG: hypothetical protein ACK5NY_03460 [Burkholderiaceae bacterium]